METKVIVRRPIGNPRRKWKQNHFIISTFNAKMEHTRLGLQNAKDLYFNMVEFGWVNPADSFDCIKACEEIGIDGLFQNWEVFGGFQESKGATGINEEKVGSYLEMTKKYRHVAGYYVWDEPLQMERIRATAEQVNRFEELDPARMPFTVAIPSYNKTDTWENGLFPKYLRNYAEIIDPVVMSLDYYPFSPRRPEPADQLDNSKLFLDIGLLRKIGLEKEIPMWFYFQSQDDPMTYEYFTFPIEKVRMQQYNALLYGAKGLQNYNIWEGALNKDGTRGPLYYGTRDLNRECLNLGHTLMALESRLVIHSPEVLPGSEDFAALHNKPAESAILVGEDLPFRCSVGEFTDPEGNRYLMILNRDYNEQRTFELKLHQKYRIYEVSKFTGEQKLYKEATDLLTQRLGAGDAILLRFQDAKEEPYLIDYVLEK